jgi:hypothetical protein
MVDDATALYVQRVHRHFEDLKQIAGQLAGLLVLAAAGGETASPDHPLLRAALDLYHQSAEGLRRVPCPPLAREHRGHMLGAAAHLGDALAAARSSLPGDIDPVFSAVKAAYADLGRAAASLPGFHIVSFERACCALAIA